MVFRYCDSQVRELPEFPVNVNGSTENIAAICNPEGNVLGMMLHPERAFFDYQLSPTIRKSTAVQEPDPEDRSLSP